MPPKAAETWLDTNSSGAFKRLPTTFRNTISRAEGAKYPPAAGRYLLYASFGCPWACRCLTVRLFKGLQDAIKIVIVDPVFKPTKPDVDEHKGWVFDPAIGVDPVYGAKSIREVYEKSCPPECEPPSRFTVPILFDTQTKTIVNNESSEIIKMLNREFVDYATGPHKDYDLDPPELQEQLEAAYLATYDSVNNGVYRCGFATSQEAYDEAVTELFGSLDSLDKQLDEHRFLVGNTITLADVRLVQTFIRFDAAYAVQFKCSLRLLREYRNLHAYMLDVVQTLNMYDAIHMDHIYGVYYVTQNHLNPHRIIAKTLPIDFHAPTDRAARFGGDPS